MAKDINPLIGPIGIAKHRMALPVLIDDELDRLVRDRLISSCNACAKRADAPPLTTTTPSSVTIKLRLLLWPEFS